MIGGVDLSLKIYTECTDLMRELEQSIAHLRRAVGVTRFQMAASGEPLLEPLTNEPSAFATRDADQPDLAAGDPDAERAMRGLES